MIQRVSSSLPCCNVLLFDSVFKGGKNIQQIVHLALDLGFVSIGGYFRHLFGKSLQCLQITGMFSHLSFSTLQ